MKICLNIEFAIEDLDSYYTIKNPAPISKEFHADLYLEDDIIELKVFYNEEEYFAEKIIRWIQKNKFGRELGKFINVKKINSPSKIKSLDFINSNLITFKSSSNNYENNQRFIPIRFNCVSIDYNPVQNKKNKNFTSEIFLSKNATQIIDEYFVISPFITNRKVWEAKNQKNEFVKFCDIFVNFDFFHSTSYDEFGKQTIITREPVINVKHSGISKESFRNHAILLKDLISFYSGNEIKISWLRHNNKETTNTLTYHKVKSSNFSNYSGIEKTFDLYYLIQHFNYNHLSDSIFISEILYKYNLSRKVKGSSQFLLLFTILEKLRTKMLKPDSDKFIFKVPKKQINKIILSKLDEIKELIHDETHSEIFERIKNSKVENIKYLPQIEQFKNFFIKSGIDLINYNLSLREVFKIRNSVIHGKLINFETEEMENLCEKLDNLCLDTILMHLFQKETNGNMLQ